MEKIRSIWTNFVSSLALGLLGIIYLMAAIVYPLCFAIGYVTGTLDRVRAFYKKYRPMGR